MVSETMPHRKMRGSINDACVFLIGPSYCTILTWFKKKKKLTVLFSSYLINFGALK